MKLKQYIYSQITISFFPIFLGLFFITSNIFLVRIASFTSVVTIDFVELLTLFSYSIPSILFYTLPISFFIGLVIALAKLSSEYELIVITSFGLNPLRILKVLFPMTLIISISLLIISLELIPKTKFLTSQMIDFKKREANFNIKPLEYGQKFDNWMIYVDKKDENVYYEVRLFKTEDSTDEFIVAKNAVINNEKGKLSFQLNDGKAFRIKKDEIDQIDFKTMVITENLQSGGTKDFTTSYNYWSELFSRDDDLDKFSFSILVSIFPLISLFLVIAFGYFNPRYEKNRSVGFGILSIVLFYVLADYLSKTIFFNSIYLVPIIWLVGSYIVFNKRTKTIY